MSAGLPGYDLWLTREPTSGGYPLKCSCCGERFFDIEDHEEHEPHCRDEDDPTIVAGTLEWDYGYDWRDDDPRIP